MDFGSRLKKLRKEHNISQEQFAKQLGVTRSAVGNYETNLNMPGIDVLVKMTDIFGCTLDFLLGKTDYNLMSNPSITPNPKGCSLDIEGLTKEDIEELKKHIEFIKWKKQSD